MPYLEHDGQLRALGPGVLTVGGGVGAAWRIPHRDLAPVHAVVTVERDGRAHLVRATPHAEIWVRGEELVGDRAVLDDGDQFRLGPAATFVYRRTARAPDATDAPAEGYLRDTRRGRLYRIGGRVLVGRDASCVVQLPDPEVSRHHLEVRAEGREYVAVPLGGAYTSVEGERLSAPRPLREGDELTVGRTTLRFTHEPSASLLAGAREPATPKAGPVRRPDAGMPTTYMGAIEVKERVRERTTRRIWLVALVIAVLVALAAGLLTR